MGRPTLGHAAETLFPRCPFARGMVEGSVAGEVGWHPLGLGGAAAKGAPPTHPRLGHPKTWPLSRWQAGTTPTNGGGHGQVQLVRDGRRHALGRPHCVYSTAQGEPSHSVCLEQRQKFAQYYASVVNRKRRTHRCFFIQIYSNKVAAFQKRMQSP